MQLSPRPSVSTNPFPLRTTQMKNITLLAALSLFGATTLSAQVIDVNQPSNTVYMAAFGQGDLAQSFIPTMATCSGGGVEMQAGAGFSGTFTCELWTGLPNAGGTLLATGSIASTPGNWADAMWAPVPVTIGTTYYMVYTNTDSGMGIAGDTSNPYAGGQVFANPGYGGFANFDYTFRTWAGGGPTFALTATGTPGGLMTFDVSGATANGPVAYLYAYGLGSFAVNNPFTSNIVTTGLSSNGFTVAAVVTADGSGNYSFSTGVPFRATGFVHVQAADGLSDALSAVASL